MKVQCTSKLREGEMLYTGKMLPTFYFPPLIQVQMQNLVNRDIYIRFESGLIQDCLNLVFLYMAKIKLREFKAEYSIYILIIFDFWCYIYFDNFN